MICSFFLIVSIMNGDDGHVMRIAALEQRVEKQDIEIATLRTTLTDAIAKISLLEKSGGSSRTAISSTTTRTRPADASARKKPTAGAVNNSSSPRSSKATNGRPAAPAPAKRTTSR